MNPPPTTTVARSDQIALLPEWRREVIDALQKGASYQRLAAMLCVSPLDKDLARPDKSFENTVAQMRDIRKPEGRDSLELMHIIPRTCLEALLSGTVGFDVANNVTDDYDSDGPGIFVIGIEIPNRNGAFVTATELQVLVDDLAQYLDEADAVLSDGEQEVVDNRPSLANRSARRLKLSEIDQQYGVYPHRPGSLPRFIESRSSLDSMREFLAATRDRQASLSAIDATGSLWSLQTPMYVGSSQNVEESITAYNPSQHPTTFEGANSPYGLTMSLLHKQGLRPIPKIITVIRVWAGKQLPIAERLVTALAGSYVHQGGFNIREGCGNSMQLPINVLDARIYILVTKAFWKANFDLSEKELDEAIELDAEIMTHKSINEVQALLDSTKALIKMEEEADVRIRKLMSEMDAATQSMQDQIEKTRKQIRGLANKTRAMELAIKIVQYIKKKRTERMGEAQVPR